MAANREIDGPTAGRIIEIMTEIVIAPSYTPEALAEFAQRRLHDGTDRGLRRQQGRLGIDAGKHQRAERQRNGIQRFDAGDRG